VRTVNDNPAAVLSPAVQIDNLATGQGSSLFIESAVVSILSLPYVVLLLAFPLLHTLAYDRRRRAALTCSGDMTTTLDD